MLITRWSLVWNPGPATWRGIPEGASLCSALGVVLSLFPSGTVCQSPGCALQCIPVPISQIPREGGDGVAMPQTTANATEGRIGGFPAVNSWAARQMRFIPLALPVLLAVLGCATVPDPVATLGCTTVPDPLPRISEMPPDSALEIRYESQGCFHHDVRTIVVRANPEPQAEISRGGTIALSREDIAGLDNLITFYRAGPGSGCTTRDDITLRWLRQGKPVLVETIVDESCASYFDESILTLRELVVRTMD